MTISEGGTPRSEIREVTCAATASIISGTKRAWRISSGGGSSGAPSTTEPEGCLVSDGSKQNGELPRGRRCRLTSQTTRQMRSVPRKAHSKAAPTAASAPRKAPITATVVEYQQCGIKGGQQLAYQIVGARKILLDVIVEQMPVCTLKMRLNGWISQRCEAKTSTRSEKSSKLFCRQNSRKRVGTLLDIGIHTAVAWIAGPGRGKARAYLAIWEPNRSGLVEIIEDLSVNAISIDGHRFKVTAIQQGPDDMRHIVLRGLVIEEDRRVFRVGEPAAGAASGQNKLHSRSARPLIVVSRGGAALSGPGALAESKYGSRKTRWEVRTRMNRRGLRSTADT